VTKLRMGFGCIWERGPALVNAKIETVEDKENARILHVEIEQETVKRHLDAAFNRLRKDVEVPGFRKGKVPRKLFERRFGTEVIWEEALEDMITEAYVEALDETDIEPIDQPEIDIEQRDESGVEFTAEIEVMPEVELGKYKGFDEDMDLEEVTEEDVDEMLQRFRESRASVTVVEDEDAELEPGRMAVCDFQAYYEDEPVEELQGEEVLMDVESEENLPGFNDALKGAKAGESREFTTTLPEEFPVEDLAGEEVSFEVKVKELKEKDLPELDEEMIKEEFGEGSLEELRESVKEQLIHRQEETAVAELEKDVISKAVENADMEVPEPLVERAIDDIIKNTETRLQNQDMDMEQFLEARGLESEDQLREEFREQAEQNVKEMLVLDAVAEEEGIEVSDEDIDAEMNNRAMSMGFDADALRQIALQNDDYRRQMVDELRHRKAIEYLANESCSEYDEVKERIEQRQQKWQKEYEEKQKEMAEAQMEQNDEETSEEEDQDSSISDES